jgi:serine/threonine-protein kinase
VGPSIEALRRRPAVTFVALVLFVIIASAASLQLVLNAVLHSRREVVVPDLTGKRLDQALDVLSPLGLALAKEGVEFDENLPAGAVLRHVPPAGLKVREGKIIHVTLSSGGKVSFVPDLAGKSLAEAQNLLRQAGMAPGALGQAYSQSRPQGEVLEQSPAAGAIGGRGQMVDLKVSKGPPPEGTLLAPDFVNRPLSWARHWADENKVRLETAEEARTDLPPGHILRQEPAPDTVLGADSSVKLAVVASPAGAAPSAARWIRYQMPLGGERVKVKVVLRDGKGERVVFDESREPGSLVEVPVEPEGPARVRIYLSGVLAEERVLE